MTQSFQLGATSTFANAYMTGQLNENLETLRSNFSGSSAPSAPVPGQLWADTSEGWLKMRNASDSAWLKVARLAADNVLQLACEGWAGALTASKTGFIGSSPRLGTVRRLIVVSDTLTASSSGNEWQFMLRKYPAANPAAPVDMFSSAAGTFTNVAGVGGGAEILANAAIALTPDQNMTVADLDQLELVVTEVGTATDITNFRAFVEIE